ncbi:hypothetical protein GCM10027020_30090 [Nocardioides salsibiostraticola]
MADDETRLRATTDGTPALPVLTDEEWAQRQPRRRRRAGRGARPRGRRPLLIRLGHRAVLVTASATIGVSAAILVVHAYDAGDRTSPKSASAQAEAEAAGTPIAPNPLEAPPAATIPDPPGPSDTDEISVRLAAQTILPGASFAPRAIESVRPRAGIAELRLTLTVRRAVSAKVILEADGSVLRRRTIRVREAGAKSVRFVDLPAGDVQWRVDVPGERAERGRATIAAPPAVTAPSGQPNGSSVPASEPTPEPTPVTDSSPAATSPPRPAPPKPDKPPPKGTGGTGGGPPGPRDPDDDGPGPIDPDDL